MSLQKPKAVCAASELQVEKFKYHGGLFTSDGKRSKEIDTRIGKAKAVLRELNSSMVTKRELSNNAKLSGFKPVFVPILICGHESSVMTERILSKVQGAVMGFCEELTT